MRLTGKPTIIEFDPFSSEATQAQSLGEAVYLGDGRIFRYAKVGASNTAPGKVSTAPAQKTNHHNLAVTAVAVGGTIVNVTLGATAAVASEYDEGFMSINAGPGIGQTFKVYYQPAIGSGLAGNITISDPPVVALTTSSKATLLHNNWSGTIEGTVQTRRAAGVGLIVGTAANYVYLQTHGVASVLADGAITLGSALALSSSVAGAAIATSTTYSTAVLTTPIGQASIAAGVDTEYRPVVLSID